MTREASPETRPEPTVPVQPAVGAVPQGWVQEYDQTEAARRLDRLAADQELITSLALQGYAGRDWEVFQLELAKYGLDVISGWLWQGVIFAKCRQRGLGGLPPPADGALRDRDTVTELANETVAKALHHFRQDVLLRNRWISSGGATLKTFFIGQCLMRFANVYRAWHGKEMRALPLVDLHEARELAEQSDGGVEQQVVDRREAARGLSDVQDERVRAALILTAADWSQREIARQLGTTEKTVERMLANHRDRVRRQRIA